jgi:hypothetical protein
VKTDVAASYARTADVRFGFGGGDPSVSSPHVVLETQQGGASWAPVPGPSGWPGAVFDNSRYHMVTHYDPDPPQSRRIREERHHDWYVDLELPTDLPAGTYRLRATGTWWDGAARQPYDVASSPFAVVQAEGATLAAERAADGAIALRLSLPATVPTGQEGASWLTTGWRLFDPWVGPAERLTVRAPLSVTVDADGVPLPDVLPAAWDETLGAHRLDAVAAGLPAAATLTIHAWLAADATPSAVETTLAP